MDERSASEVEAVVADLETITERLSDLAMSSLREAIARRETARPQLERQLTRARHAVERAISILNSAADAADPAGDPGDEDGASG